MTLFSVVLLCSLAAFAPAEEAPGANAIAIEFQAIPPNPGVKYTIRCLVTLDGSDHQFKAAMETDANQTGKALAVNFVTALRNDKQKGWVVEQQGDKVWIKGWKDPKTEKFFPVKAVTFTSDDLPKDSAPKVTDPRKKA